MVPPSVCYPSCYHVTILFVNVFMHICLFTHATGHDCDYQTCQMIQYLWLVNINKNCVFEPLCCCWCHRVKICQISITMTLNHHRLIQICLLMIPNAKWYISFQSQPLNLVISQNWWLEPKTDDTHRLSDMSLCLSMLLMIH